MHIGIGTTVRCGRKRSFASPKGQLDIYCRPRGPAKDGRPRNQAVVKGIYYQHQKLIACCFKSKNKHCTVCMSKSFSVASNRTYIYLFGRKSAQYMLLLSAIIGNDGIWKPYAAPTTN